RLAPCNPVELPQLLERVDPHVRVRADAELDAPVEEAFDRQETCAEVRLGGRTGTDACTGGREQVELVPVRMGCMDDGRARAEATARVEQLDRPDPVLGEALPRSAGLLVGVHVQRQRLCHGVATELLEPVAWAG